jgi:copper chaperone CopZ
MNKTNAMKTSVIVQNLRCNGCANTIASKLSEIKNITNIEVDIDASNIQFDCIEPEDILQVKNKLKALGYPEADDANSLLYKAKSLVSCATGKFKD